MSDWHYIVRERLIHNGKGVSKGGKKLSMGLCGC